MVAGAHLHNKRQMVQDKLTSAGHFPPRLRRERDTIEAMIAIYCRAHHQRVTTLCENCSKLLLYAEKRLSHCPFAENKPTCGNCKIHCYKNEMQTKVREVMRFSGPRMLLRHPIMALLHLLDGRRRPRSLPRKQYQSKTKVS